MNSIPKERVVIIIPTYNEALAIESTLRAVFAHTKSNTDFDVHVLIFDSCSTDTTQGVVKTLLNEFDKLHLAMESEKSGLGSAYRQAMQFAIDELKADIVFEYDADGSHQPKYINPMLELLKINDVVVGSRYVKNGKIPSNWGLHRKLFSVIGNWVARSMLHPKYLDLTSGFRATRTKLLKRALPDKFLSNQYAYKLHLFWLLHKANARIAEYPIEFIDRTQGESKLPANSISDSLRVVFTIRFQEMKRYLKMCCVGLLGMAVQFTLFNQLRMFLPIESAAQLAIGSAILSNFILNQLYTFKDLSQMDQGVKTRLVSRKLFIFILYSMAMIKLQTHVLAYVADLLGKGALIENISMCMAIGLGSILNYFVYSKYVWPFEQDKNRFVN